MSFNFKYNNTDGISKLNRYSIIDDYTLEELKIKYLNSHTQEKIELLEFLNNKRSIDANRIPYDIALMAIEDKDLLVVQWMALNVNRFKLDSSGIWDYTKGHWENKYHKELAEKLANHENEYIRACFAEKNGLKNFDKSTFIEKLALMRHDHILIYSEIKNIYDIDNKKSNLSMIERDKLIIAFLSNRKIINELYKYQEDLEPSGFGEILTSLWNLTSKWDPKYRVPYFTYRYLPCRSELREETYKACTNLQLKHALLEGAHSINETFLRYVSSEKIESDFDYRLVFAWEKYKFITQEDIDEALKTENTDIFTGIHNNDFLSLKDYEYFADKIHSLSHQTSKDDLRDFIFNLPINERMKYKRDMQTNKV